MCKYDIISHKAGIPEEQFLRKASVNKIKT